MATQLKRTDFPYSPPRSTVRVAFQPLPILPAVTAAMATMPAAVRSATLDELNDGTAQIAAMATALVAKAGELLSPHMYRAFLRWAECAVHALMTATEEECDRRTALAAEAVRLVAATDAQNDQDGFFKAYLMAIEIADAPAFGPLIGDAASTYSVDKLAIGFAGDVAHLSPLAAMIDELSATARSPETPLFSFSPPIGEAMAAVFRDARDLPQPLNMDGYNRFMRGPLIRWQKAYARYEEAADELATFDREVHTPASALWTETSEKLGDSSDAAAVDAEAAACAALDLAQERYDTLCSARYDALDELLRVPAPGSAELAIKLRLYSEDYGWGSEQQRSAGEQMTIDARRYGRAGALIQTDQPILDAFAAYQGRYRDLKTLPADASAAVEDEHFARMDEACDPLCSTRATTIEGVIARLRFGLHGVTHEDWLPDVVLNPGSETFRTKMPVADLSLRMIWQSIEDLARIGGVSLAESAA